MVNHQPGCERWHMEHTPANRAGKDTDTWRDGFIRILLIYDRLTWRESLTESDRFVQIGDENVHRVRALDEILGEDMVAQLI